MVGLWELFHPQASPCEKKGATFSHTEDKRRNGGPELKIVKKSGPPFFVNPTYACLSSSRFGSFDSDNSL